MVELLSLNFRVITVNILDVRIFISSPEPKAHR